MINSVLTLIDSISVNTRSHMQLVCHFSLTFTLRKHFNDNNIFAGLLAPQQICASDPNGRMHKYFEVSTERLSKRTDRDSA